MIGQDPNLQSLVHVWYSSKLHAIQYGILVHGWRTAEIPLASRKKGCEEMSLNFQHLLEAIWLVVDLPLWKMMEWTSVGMMTFPTEWKNHPEVPSHQPAKKQEMEQKKSTHYPFSQGDEQMNHHKSQLFCWANHLLLLHCHPLLCADTVPECKNNGCKMAGIVATPQKNRKNEILLK